MVSARQALVTGDAGFLGRHFRAHLERDGWQVLGLDTVRGRHEDCRRLFAGGLAGGLGYDLVVHCAAVIGGRRQIEGDPLAVAENLELDAALFGWAARRRPGRVLYLSSSAVYPTHLQQVPPPPAVHLPAFTSGQQPRRLGAGFALAEAMAEVGGYCGAPDQVYGWAKLAGEVLAASYRAQGGRVTIVRPFSGYGPDQSTDYPFGAFLARAWARADPFEVWGSGDQVRDWVHVDDLVAASLGLTMAGVAGPVNICSGVGVSFEDLAGQVCQAAGYAPQLLRRLDAPAGVAYRVGDPATFRRVWRQPLVPLEEGIRRALDQSAQAEAGQQ